MGHSIYLISKKFIEPKAIANTILSVAQKSNYNFYKSENIIINIHINKEDMEGYLDIYIRDKEGYSNTFNNLDDIIGYGIILRIEYQYEDEVLIHFLRELLTEMTDLLIYVDEIKLNHGFAFTKDHLDAFSGNDSYDLFGKPPQNLSN